MKTISIYLLNLILIFTCYLTSIYADSGCLQRDDFEGGTLKNWTLTNGSNSFSDTSYAEAKCNYYEDFEEGTLSGWTVLNGVAAFNQSVVFNGYYSLSLINNNSYGSIVSNLNNFGFGQYSGYFYVTGYASDAYIRFHYMNTGNFYQLAMLPAGSDNPNLGLTKRINGVITTLAAVQPTFGLNQWFKFLVDRSVNGDINVYINDTLRISVNDNTFTAPGSVCLMSYDAAYVDNFCYKSYPSNIVDTVKQNLVKLYPVPSQKDINISSAGDFDNIVVTDMVGRMICSSGAKIINIESLKSGIYFAHVYNQGKKISTLRFIKY
ncbi:MAG: T9SS type A sorting domain-containing protein [Bacteroidia bacterium]|nr:T9SS type A sorting domain-containing protein [Bacteroidia bacterium]